jgi:hypothetical protein
MKLGKVLSSAVLFALTSMAASSASAEYVCYVTYYASAPAFGNGGYLYAMYTSGPSCTGTFSIGHHYCTDGATSVNCASATTFRYNQNGLLAMLRELRAAAAADQRVVPYNSACNGGGSGVCGAAVYFWSN